jgi:hypothetical protein
MSNTTDNLIISKEWLKEQYAIYSDKYLTAKWDSDAYAADGVLDFIKMVIKNATTAPDMQDDAIRLPTAVDCELKVNQIDELVCFGRKLTEAERNNLEYADCGCDRVDAAKIEGFRMAFPIACEWMRTMYKQLKTK